MSAVVIQSGPVTGSTGQIAEQAMTPITSTGSSLAVGRIRMTADLYSVFANTEDDTRRMRVILDAAGMSEYTNDDLAENLKAACKMADEADKAEGFKAPEGAKGQDKYGPRRSSMNARSSEIRQVFGAVRAGAPIEANQGYAKALKASRAFLKEKGIQWDGSKAPTEEEKAAKADTALQTKVRADWMAEHPQQAGESIRDYTERMLSACEILIAEEQTKEAQKALKAAADALVKKHGIEFCGDLAVMLADMFNSHVEQQAELNGKGPEVVM